MERRQRSRVFTAGEVQRLVGITQRQLDYWDRSGLVQPHGLVANGPGSRRLYTTLDVVRFKIVRRLLEVGLSLQKIRKAFGFIELLPDEPAPLAELELVSDGEHVSVRQSNDRLLDPLTGQYLLQLPLANLLAEVDANVEPSILVPKSSKLHGAATRQPNLVVETNSRR